MGKPPKGKHRILFCQPSKPAKLSLIRFHSDPALWTWDIVLSNSTSLMDQAAEAVLTTPQRVDPNWHKLSHPYDFHHPNLSAFTVPYYRFGFRHAPKGVPASWYSGYAHLPAKRTLSLQTRRLSSPGEVHTRERGHFRSSQATTRSPHILAMGKQPLACG